MTDSRKQQFMAKAEKEVQTFVGGTMKVNMKPSNYKQKTSTVVSGTITKIECTGTRVRRTSEVAQFLVTLVCGVNRVERQVVVETFRSVTF